MTDGNSAAVRLRFPPSPTGHWHLGGARTALFNWLFTRKHQGKLVLRIEDTDKTRSETAYEIEIAETMKWLGLDWDEGPRWTRAGEKWESSQEGEYGPYRQSERTDIYRSYLEQLLKEKKAYYCYCTKPELEEEQKAMQAQGLAPKYGGRCRDLTSAPEGKSPEAIRFRMPEEPVSFDDMIRGTVTFDATLFGDVIIAKDLDSALYNFAVTVDDHLMKISHVIRGEEHLANTPKQIFLQRALGFNEPRYAHLPLILAADRSKLSKRYAETSMLQYREDGYLPEAMLNFLVILGWHPAGDREIFSLDEMIEEFDIARVQKAGAVFNPEKLDWLNAQYIRKMPLAELAERVRPFLKKEIPEDIFLRLLSFEKERIHTLKEFAEHITYVFEVPAYEPELLVWRKSDRTKTVEALTGLEQILGTISEADLADREKMLDHLEPLVQKFDRGTVFWPLRVALSGQEASPDPLEILSVLPKPAVVGRVKDALQKIS
jgi:glutamyl-tRNA synthetase